MTSNHTEEFLEVEVLSELRRVLCLLNDTLQRSLLLELEHLHGGTDRITFPTVRWAPRGSTSLEELREAECQKPEVEHLLN